MGSRILHLPKLTVLRNLPYRRQPSNTNAPSILIGGKESGMILAASLSDRLSGISTYETEQAG
jgi:hypothetical protein